MWCKKPTNLCLTPYTDTVVIQQSPALPESVVCPPQSCLPLGLCFQRCLSPSPCGWVVAREWSLALRLRGPGWPVGSAGRLLCSFRSPGWPEEGAGQVLSPPPLPLSLSPESAPVSQMNRESSLGKKTVQVLFKIGLLAQVLNGNGMENHFYLVVYLYGLDDTCSFTVIVFSYPL